MFRRRTNSQKPASELYAAFRKAFPHLRLGAKESSAATTSSDSSASVTKSSMDGLMDHSKSGNEDDSISAIQTDNHQDNDNVLMESDHWRFTPNVLDNSFNFSSYVNQTPGEMTPTPGGFSNLFHNQAGDLHAPATAFHMGTALTSDNNQSVPAVEMQQAFHPHLLQSQPFNDPGHFQQQQSFAPSTFVHRDSGYDTTEPAGNDFSDSRAEDESHQLELADLHSGMYGANSATHISSLEKFRFHITLNAPTAMIRSKDEIPVTYLNKGQPYTINISDSLGAHPSVGMVKYRTVIRISFEDEQQRQRPSQSWQLWMEGRGLAESHQRAGKLQAVEFVDPTQGGDIEGRKPKVELEAASFDCFSVTWIPSQGSSVASTAVSVRFNFLSTDFSHSKGVKGIPVRLCAKTEVISSSTPESPPGPIAEICFCKVKLFRDHGAERKLSNDVAHIKKTIDKLKQQISQVENGMREGNKRKRSGSMSNSHRAGKIAKHKRAWSVSSQGSSGRAAIEDDLHSKLATMQDMFSSPRPVSVLYLRGYDDDDPDAFPVSLPGGPVDISQVEQQDRRATPDILQSGRSTPTNPAVSRTPSSQSLPTDHQSKNTADLRASMQTSDHWTNFTPTSSHDFTNPFPLETKISKPSQDQAVPQWIKALGVDPTYQAPPERSIKPVACFYVFIKILGETPDDDCYRAVYLMERTLKDLVSSIATKCGVNAPTVHKTLRITSKGLKILVDDDVVREMPEGQDMIVEFNNLESVKHEPGSGHTTPKAPGTRHRSSSLEMRLIF